MMGFVIVTPAPKRTQARGVVGEASILDIQGQADMLRVLIVEDHVLMREMVREYLQIEADLSIDGVAATAKDALAFIKRRIPDIVLVDVALPDMSGIELVRILSGQYPELPLAMLSGHRERSHIDGAMGAGARGYILKGDSYEIPRAIRRIVGGERYVSPALGSW